MIFPLCLSRTDHPAFLLENTHSSPTGSHWEAAKGRIASQRGLAGPRTLLRDSASGRLSMLSKALSAIGSIQEYLCPLSRERPVELRAPVGRVGAGLRPRDVTLPEVRTRRVSLSGDPGP